MTRSFDGSPPFPAGARVALGDDQLRRNLARATTTIRAKRDRVVAELDGWEDLRLAGEAAKRSALGQLDQLLVELEAKVTAAGGTVHWARDAAEANRIVVAITTGLGAREVVKVKSMTTAEIGLNAALEAGGIAAYETDLAELIVQLGDDLPSHIVVPAIHKSRAQIRDTFVEHMGEWGRPARPGLTDQPADLADTARLHLRERFLTASVGISGANFLVADTGAVVVVESEGNGRMCLTLPRTLITVAGIDKVIPSWEDLDVFLQVLPRSATGERMNPYNSVWTGVTPGDGPEAFHLVLVDNGRTRALADEVGRQALRCIRCAACLNVCPVYERVGGHAYGSVYPGPIGAVLTPQLDHVAGDEVAASLPYASTLCGACFDACPVRIDIPRLLVHLRGEVVDTKRHRIPTTDEQATMAAAAWVLRRPRRLAAATRAAERARRLLAVTGVATVAGRLGRRRPVKLPGLLGRWAASRALPVPEEASFASWWRASGRPTTDRGWHRSTKSRRIPHRAPLGLSPVRDQPRTGPASARAEILERIAQALGSERQTVAVPRAYREAASDLSAEPVERFASRVSDYQATVTRVRPDQVGAAVAELVARRGSTEVAVPVDLPAGWLDRLDAVIRPDDPMLSTAELDRIGSVITACAVAVAETGTVILDAGAGQGRRALSLVPDHHVVVVDAGQIVGGVPEAVARLTPAAPQTWISGPSATSDIELSRVEGVHGPRHLDVVLVESSAEGSAAG